MSEKRGFFSNLFNINFNRDGQPEDGYEDNMDYEGQEEFDAWEAPQEPYRPQPSARESAPQPTPKVVPLQDAPLRHMMFFEPHDFSDVREIINSLRSGRPIIVNVENLTDGTAQRVVDYLGGAVISLSAQICYVSRCVFALTPVTMELGGNMLEQPEQPASRRTHAQENARVFK